MNLLSLPLNDIYTKRVMFNFIALPICDIKIHVMLKPSKRRGDEEPIL
jgi:hypothetical protein